MQQAIGGYARRRPIDDNTTWTSACRHGAAASGLSGYV